MQKLKSVETRYKQKQEHTSDTNPKKKRKKKKKKEKLKSYINDMRERERERGLLYQSKCAIVVLQCGDEPEQQSVKEIILLVHPKLHGRGCCCYSSRK
jgi:hypothetical protein